MQYLTGLLVRLIINIYLRDFPILISVKVALYILHCFSSCSVHSMSVASFGAELCIALCVPMYQCQVYCLTWRPHCSACVNLIWMTNAFLIPLKWEFLLLLPSVVNKHHITLLDRNGIINQFWMYLFYFFWQVIQRYLKTWFLTFAGSFTSLEMNKFF